MKNLICSKRFKKDYQQVVERGCRPQKLHAVLALLLKNESILTRHKHHKLSGSYDDFWECHIEPDWRLIYRIKGQTVELARTGTSVDLFYESGSTAGSRK